MSSVTSVQRPVVSSTSLSQQVAPSNTVASTPDGTPPAGTSYGYSGESVFESSALQATTSPQPTLGLTFSGRTKFKGTLQPNPDTQTVRVLGKDLSVAYLEPGDVKTKQISVNGQKWKVKLEMNEDGTVDVEGKLKRSFFVSG